MIRKTAMFIAVIVVILAASTALAQKGVKVEKIAYGGWPNCVRMTNGTVELVATTDVGPRIIRFGFVGQDNEFFEDPNQIGKTGGSEWMSYGGHRFWLAPEAKPRTYFPDNTTVKYLEDNGKVFLTPDIENTTGMEKAIELTLDPNENHVTVIHKVTNHGMWPVELAPWALTVMAPGGELIIPQETYSPHPDIPDEPGQKIDKKCYLPVRNLVLWSYTKLSDPRWVFLSKYIILKQDPNAKKPQKLGISNQQNWAGYARKGHLFVKKVIYQPGATYPDGGSSYETFTNSDMLELESLGPVITLAPGASVTHREDWYLFDGVKFENTDASIDANVLPKVKSVLD